MVLGLEMRDPDGAVHGRAADGAVPLGQDLSGCALLPILRMRSVEVERSAEQIIQHAGRAVGGRDLPHDGGGRVSAPVDGAVALTHRRPQTAANLGLVIGERFRLEAPRCKLGDSLQHAEHGRFGDLLAIQAALRGRGVVQRKLVGRPDGTGIHLGRSLQDCHSPRLLAVHDRPVERGRPAIALDSGMHDQTDESGPDRFGDRRLEHRGDDELGRVVGHRPQHGVFARGQRHRHRVAALGKLDLEPLAEAVVRRGQEMNVHDNSSYLARVD